MNYAIVDLQGFKDDSNNFIVKELSFLTQNIKFSDVIKSPYTFDALNLRSQKIAYWLTNNYHGLNWSEGYITIDELRKTITPIPQNKIMYVKGEEKIDWLRDIIDEQNKMNLLIVNLESIRCELTLHNDVIDSNNVDNYNDRDLEKNKEKVYICSYSKHKKKSNNFNCALRYVVKLKKWYTSYCKKK